ncbi:TPA: elongation factor Ts [Candidatus Taylorbacteria bacterium]|nr:elongation factor Ts [Candidatus Taylorbacteria bacterium]
MVTLDQIKSLREATGLSVMQVKRALEEANGDAPKALAILKKKSKDVAAKKSDRTFGAGTIASYIHGKGAVGAMVELVCETDFVSGNEGFVKLAYDIALHVAAANPEFNTLADVTDAVKDSTKALFLKEVEGKPKELHEKILQGKLDAYFKERVLAEQMFVKDPDITITDLINEAIHKFGEKIAVGRFVRFSIK